MGTLFNQPVRKWFEYDDKDIINLIEEIKKISTKTKLPIDQVLKVYEIKELERKNNLLKANGDIYDEQQMGFGELLEKLISSIDGLSEGLER